MNQLRRRPQPVRTSGTLGSSWHGSCPHGSARTRTHGFSVIAYGANCEGHRRSPSDTWILRTVETGWDAFDRADDRVLDNPVVAAEDGHPGSVLLAAGAGQRRDAPGPQPRPALHPERASIESAVQAVGA